MMMSFYLTCSFLPPKVPSSVSHIHSVCMCAVTHTWRRRSVRVPHDKRANLYVCSPFRVGKHYSSPQPEVVGAGLWKAKVFSNCHSIVWWRKVWIYYWLLRRSATTAKLDFTFVLFLRRDVTNCQIRRRWRRHRRASETPPLGFFDS